METSLTILFFLLIFWDPVPSHPPGYIWEYNISRYYSVMPDQKRYYLHRTYEQDFKMNCQGDCLVTASGYKLKESDEMKIVACPPDIKLGARLRIEWIGEVTCQDRGWSIKGRRLDLWTGIGDRGLTNIWNKRGHSGPREVYLIQ